MPAFRMRWFSDEQMTTAAQMTNLQQRGSVNSAVVGMALEEDFLTCDIGVTTAESHGHHF